MESIEDMNDKRRIENLKCPISLMLMLEPVTIGGFSFEKQCIEKIIANKGVHPITRKKIKESIDDLHIDIYKKNEIVSLLEKYTFLQEMLYQRSNMFSKCEYKSLKTFDEKIKYIFKHDQVPDHMLHKLIYKSLLEIKNSIDATSNNVDKIIHEKISLFPNMTDVKKYRPKTKKYVTLMLIHLIKNTINENIIFFYKKINKDMLLDLFDQSDYVDILLHINDKYEAEEQIYTIKFLFHEINLFNNIDIFNAIIIIYMKTDKLLPMPIILYIYMQLKLDLNDTKISKSAQNNLLYFPSIENEINNYDLESDQINLFDLMLLLRSKSHIKSLINMKCKSNFSADDAIKYTLENIKNKSIIKILCKNRYIFNMSADKLLLYNKLVDACYFSATLYENVVNKN